MTIIFKITIGSLSVIAQEGSTTYLLESIPILGGCPSIEPCAFLAFFFFHPLQCYLCAGRISVHHGENASAGFTHAITR